MSDIEIIKKTVVKKHPCDSVHGAIARTEVLIESLESEIREVIVNNTHGMQVIEKLESENKRLEVKANKFEGELISIREFISGLEQDVFGSNGNGEIEWSMRDEIIDRLTQTLTTTNEDK